MLSRTGFWLVGVSFVYLAQAGGCHADADGTRSGAQSHHRPGARAGQHGPARVPDVSAKNLYRDGNLLVGGEPTAEGLESLQREGVRTIIDLRTEPDKMVAEAELAKRLGLHYYAIPMRSNELTAEQAAAVLEVMKKHPKGDVLIHCAGGNRAAAAYGLYLGATGQCPIQEALERARTAGLKNSDLAEDVRRRLTTRPALDAPPAATQPGE